MKKIILRGHSGFIGKNCAHLLKKKYKIEKFSKQKKIKKSKNNFFFPSLCCNICYEIN